MEQQLKERLVGAAVLVTLGVILIPLLLDGPDSGDSARPEPGRSDADNGTGRIVVEIKRDADAPAGPAPQARPGPKPADSGRATMAEPAATASAPAGSSEGVAPTSGAPPADAASVEPSRPSGSGTASAEASRSSARGAPPAARSSPAAGASPVDDGWAVQVGSFGSRDNAEKLRRQLSASGFPVFLMRIESGGRTFHRVRVGPYADRAGAEAAAGRLAASGPGGTVVRQGG